MRNLFISLPLTFLFWPFNYSILNSQVLGLLLLLFVLLVHCNYLSNLRWIKIPPLSFLFYMLFLVVLLFSIANQNADSDIFKFLYYILMIPFLFVISFIYKEMLQGKQNDKNIILLTAFPFVLFCLIELVFPSFHQFVSPYVMSEAAKTVYENNAGGNIFRFLGWSGFLFADYSVALAFTALGVAIFNRYPSIFLIIFELACITLSLIAGRSGLPIIFVYVVVILFFKSNSLRMILISLGLVILSSYTYSKFGNEFFIWLLEPFYRYLEYGTFSSGSVNETRLQFESFLYNIKNRPLDILIGSGVYFTSNSSYFSNGFVGADSGVVRLYYSTGFLGLLFFLFLWVSILLKVVISFFCGRKDNRTEKVFLITILSYGLLFTYKSEWLYHKFFIFIVFYFYHLIYSKIGFNLPAQRAAK